jgi:type I restriction enzyme R subunit
MSPGNVTDTSERGLEDLIVAAMTRVTESAEGVAEAHGLYGSGGWLLGDWRDYEREYAVDLRQLAEFLRASQPAVAEAAQLDEDGPVRR